MSLLARAAAWIVLGGLSTLGVIIFAGLVTGRVNTTRLLYGIRRDGSHYLSPERIQLLLATIALTGAYLLRVVHATPHGQLPDVPSAWLILLGGSHGVYLGRKAFAMMR